MSENKKNPIFMNTDGYEDFKLWNGKEVEILGTIANPDDNSIIDACAMPQFLVKLLETGEVNTAYVDEISEEFWTPEMKAALDGQDEGFSENTQVKNPYEGELATYFDYGLALAKHKSNN